MILLTFGNHFFLNFLLCITGNVLHTAENRKFLKKPFKIRKYLLL